MGLFEVASGDVVGSDHMNQAISQSIPRFADVAERDAAYAAFPGWPQPGMQCFIVDKQHRQTYFNTYGWVHYFKGQASTGGYVAPAAAHTPAVFTMGSEPGSDPDCTIIPWTPQGIPIPVSGDWHMNVYTELANFNPGVNYVQVMLADGLNPVSGFWRDQIELAPGGNHHFTVSGILDFTPAMVAGVSTSTTGGTSYDVLALTFRISMRP